MNSPLISVCIPAYNRAEYLRELLDSILSQEFENFEIIVCEDLSPQRPIIADICRSYVELGYSNLHYVENDRNLGYDANIRKLISLAAGEYIFFMGNDDVMAVGAMRRVEAILATHQNVGVILRSYSWFDNNDKTRINQTVRFFSEERVFKAGQEAITIAFRRSGVISGYIVHTRSARDCATGIFDGGLYYQMHLTINVLSARDAVNCPEVLVLSRAGIAPDFGNSAAERSSYTPGVYTTAARLKMVSTALKIAEYNDISEKRNLLRAIQRDYANYFYPYIKDQLDLPLTQYAKLCAAYFRMGFGRYPLFYVYCSVCYILGERRFDSLTRVIRNSLGRSPHFGIGNAGKASSE